MAVVLKRTYSLTAWPWRAMPWVRVPDGLEFTLYEVSDLVLRGVTVPSTPEEDARWRTALEAFRTGLQDAERIVRHAHGVRRRSGLMVDNGVVRLRRYDLLPGRRARSRQAFARCEAAMRAAAEAYRPVREEIEARLAQTSADHS
ncbi:hypothetical protein [Kitasatospora sp. NPDC058218]|uniref:hypothetical protein n=1 Tax=Kitasatospora sp. NPDC058218 TaxID=3346385 RepID=UPI0036D95C5A